jgi:hypothetical protein
VLFRRELELAAAPVSARGFVSADSRYRLFVNGRRVQWGPAPCDPRSYEADPLDLARWLVPGRNVIGVEVLYYGHGDGTWPFGKPGFLLALRVEEPGGRVSEILSDESWRAFLDRAHRPGQFKRSYLRALQEDFDARAQPVGWSAPGFAPDAAWLAPQLLDAGADRPAAAGTHADYLGDGGIAAATAVLRAREVPLVRETLRPMGRLVRSGRVRWRRDPRDWFEFRIPGSFEVVDDPAAAPAGEGAWRLDTRPGEGVFATFELPEQMVGFPFLSMEAPEGAAVELVTQEAHDPAGTAWLDSGRFAWTRFVCRAGENRFECFDYESLRFLQVHVHAAEGPVLLGDVGLRRRGYPWPGVPSFRASEPTLQRLLEASFNTLTNAAQETIVDGMGRERQQYSGDVSHQLQATRLVCGDRQLARRFLRTFAMGQTLEGYFLDCWPAYDRMNRLAQRQVGATEWGPLLDHGVSFVLDAFRHYQESGESDLPLLLYPRFVRFAAYLLERRGKDGLLPIDGWGVPTVWIDDGFARPRHKQCAFNLFTAAVLKAALAPLAALAGDAAGEKRYAAAADALVAATVGRFWSRERSLFVSNLPWEDEEGGARLDDARSRRLSSSTSARVAAPRSRSRRSPSPARRSCSRFPPTPIGGCRRSRATGASAPCSASCASAGRCCHRCCATTPSPSASTRVPTRPTSGATAPSFRSSRSTWTSRASGRSTGRKAEARPQLGDLEAPARVPHPRSDRSALPVGELVLPVTEGRGVALTASDRALGLERFALPAGETTEFDVPPVRLT